MIVILSESIKRHVVKLTFSALDRWRNVTDNLILLFNFLFHVCDSSIRLLLEPLKKRTFILENFMSSSLGALVQLLVKRNIRHVGMVKTEKQNGKEMA